MELISPDDRAELSDDKSFIRAEVTLSGSKINKSNKKIPIVNTIIMAFTLDRFFSPACEVSMKDEMGCEY